MNKFAEWFGRNRKTIGYVIGGLNLGSGAGQVITGDTFNGLVWIVIGLMIIFDTKEFK